MILKATFQDMITVKNTVCPIVVCKSHQAFVFEWFQLNLQLFDTLNLVTGHLERALGVLD